jgi:hypothetical protein
MSGRKVTASALWVNCRTFMQSGGSDIQVRISFCKNNQKIMHENPNAPGRLPVEEENILSPVLIRGIG